MQRTPRFCTATLSLVLILAVLVTPRALLQRTFAAQFTSGHVVVYRVGDGVAGLANTGARVFLDEYTPGGVLVQSIELPTATVGVHRRLVASGTATSEGLLTRSTDGKFLVLAGYDSAIPAASSLTGTTAAAVPRVVARVDALGNLDTTTALGDFASGSSPRGVASTNGFDLWVAGGAGGVRHALLGSTTSTQLSTTVTNLRATGIFDGQLYVAAQSGTTRVATVGVGLPTTAGNTIVNLPGLPTSTGSPYGHFLADLDPGVPGVDTLYVADDSAGLSKYSLVAGTWTTNGTIGVAADAYRGLTGSVSGPTVSLFATRRGGSGATGGGELVSITDTTGYNATLSATPTLLATAATNTAFRGVALAPIPEPSSTPTVSLSVSSSSGAEADATSVTITATTSGPVIGAQSVDVVVGGAGITTDDFTLSSPSISVPNGGTGGSITFTVVDDLLFEGPETATISLVNPTAGIVLGSPTSQPIAIADNDAPPLACSALDTPISAIQGSGAAAALTGLVTVQGVVTADYEGPSPALRGFYLQELVPDSNPATSDAIFVFNGNNNTVGLGQVVQVTGTAGEFQDQTQVSATTIELCGPTATVSPLDVTLPVPPPVAGVAYLERFEGLLVRFPQTLYVTEHFQLGRFGQVVVSSGDRLQQPTSVALPGSDALALQAVNDLNRLIVDDDVQSQNPDPILFGRNGDPLSAANTLRGGDTATGLSGVLTYTWAGNAASGNAFRLRPNTALGGAIPVFAPSNTRPSGPPSVGGRLKVASFNVLNYFLTLDVGTQANCGPTGFKQECRGAETMTELTRQRTKLLQALRALDADVVGLMELENGHDTSGNEVNAVADIVSGLNAIAGAGTYGYVDTGVVGTDTIRVGVIYKTASVAPVGSPLVDVSAIHNRPPVAQTFSENATGERLTVVVNHFKSKGCLAPTDPGYSPTDPNNDQGDGQGCYNAQRVAQAQAILTFVDTTVVPAAGDPDVMLLGDFNAYAKEDPIRALEQAGYTNLPADFGGSSAYSYVFDGQWGYLDYAFASPSLVGQVIGAGEFHINADEPSVLDYNTNFKSAAQVDSLFAADQFRTSDHDPVVVGLSLADSVAPDTVIDSTPPSPSGSASAVFAFHGVDSGSGVSRFECSVDGGAFITCASGVTYTGLANGSHTFAVRAVDGAGNTDPTPATHDWVVDVPMPTTVALLAPNGGLKVFSGVPSLIRWTVTGAATIDVHLSRNGGATFAPIAGCTDLPGSATSCSWTPAGPATLNAVVRVTARGGASTATDQSDGRFTIAIGRPAIVLLRPLTSMNWRIGSTQSIVWAHNLGSGAPVTIELSRNGGATWETLVASLPSSSVLGGRFDWVVTGPPSNDVRVRVRSLETPAGDASRRLGII